MKEGLLLIMFIGIGFLGYHSVDRWERFLAAGYRRQEPEPHTAAGRLSLGFLDPMPAERITGILARLSKDHPDVSLQLYSGTAEELLQGFSEDRYDAIFACDGDEDIAGALWLKPQTRQTAAGKDRRKVV